MPEPDRTDPRKQMSWMCQTEIVQTREKDLCKSVQWPDPSYVYIYIRVLHLPHLVPKAVLTDPVASAGQE